MSSATFNERSIAAILFVAALLLYAPGIWWGLPYATAPDRIRPWGSDELAPLGPVAELHSVFVAPDAQNFDPRYPLFHYFMQALTVGPYMVWLRLTGGLAHPSVEFPYGLADPVTSLATMTLLARIVSLFMAAGVVVAAFYTATILWNRRTGLLAAVLALLSYPMFYYSRTSNVDMGALFWTSLGLMVFAACLRDGLTPRRAVWLGVFAALATATKDASYAAFLPILLYLAVRHRQRMAASSSWETWKAPILCAIGGAVVYLAASGLLFSFSRFRLHLHFITHGSPHGYAHFLYSTPATLSGYLSLLGSTFTHLQDALSTPILILAVAGVALCLRADRSKTALILPAAGILLGVIIPVRYVLFRFIIVIAFVLVFFAARALAAMLESGYPMLRRLAPLVIAITCLWSFTRAADLSWQMITDNRYEASAWLRLNAQPGDRIGYYADASKLPRLERGIVTVPMPGQTIYASQSEPEPIMPPEFILVIPVQHFETDHEFTLPSASYAALRNGSTGYQLILGLRPRSILTRRPVPFVNPAVQVFVRRDRLARLKQSQAGIELNRN